MSRAGSGSTALGRVRRRQRDPHVVASTILAVAVGLVLLWAATTVLVPAYVNDPGTMPPAGPAESGALGATVRALGLLVAVVVPMVLPVLALLVAFEAVTLWRRWTRPVKKLNAATLAVCLAAVVAMWSPWGQALTAAALD